MQHSVRLPTIALFALLGLCAAAFAASLDRSDVERRAEAAARYLVAVESADGHFHYEFDFLQSRFLSDDNIVRQAGAGFVLNQFLLESGDVAFEEPAARAIGYYESHSVPRGDGLLLSEDQAREGGRAGGTALALLAELVHSRATGSDFRPDLRRAWLQGLAAQQLASGGIAQSPTDSTADSYATGETWLALAHYAAQEPAEPALQPLLARLQAYAMPHFVETPDTMFTHWGLMAAAERFRTTGEPRYRDFIAALASVYLSEVKPANANRVNACAGLEGLIAAATVLGPQEELGQKLRDTVEAELPLQLQLQLPEGTTRLQFGPDNYYEDPKLEIFAGAFRNGAYVMRARIDSTQHCLSALLLYRKMIGAGDWRR